MLDHCEGQKLHVEINALKQFKGYRSIENVRVAKYFRNPFGKSDLD